MSYTMVWGTISLQLLVSDESSTLKRDNTWYYLNTKDTSTQTTLTAHARKKLVSLLFSPLSEILLKFLQHVCVKYFILEELPHIYLLGSFNELNTKLDKIRIFEFKKQWLFLYEIYFRIFRVFFSFYLFCFLVQEPDWKRSEIIIFSSKSLLQK